MVFMPRGSSKSTYSSIVFPSRYLGVHPQATLILASYGEELPMEHGNRTRSIIRQSRYEKIFGCSLSKDSAAKDHFRLTNGSTYYATGMGASVVGHRAHGIIIDDPIKNIQDARSETKRKSTWASYSYDLRPCLIPGGFIVLVQTRWHEEDIAGRILPEDWNGESGYFDCRDGMRWRVLCLQARCETHTDPLGRKLGEYLWPEWFGRSSPGEPEKYWQEFESDPTQWASMCQQIPRPPEGAFFLEASFLVDGPIDESGKIEKIPVAYPPFCDVVFCTVDSASKTGNEHAGTAAVWCAYTKNGGPNGPVPKLVILDWDYHQIQGASLELWLPTVFTRGEELARLCKARLGSKGALIEDKDSGVILLQQAKNKRWPATPINSKLTALGKKGRAFNASPYVAAGDVKISEHAYRKVVTYKGSTKNHLMSQILYFTMESKDNDPVDLLDATTYAISLACGNLEGF
jgi:hypothetical protein